MSRAQVARRCLLPLIALVAASIAAAPTVAQDELPDYIANVTITSATVDMRTGVPEISGTVTCLVDVDFLRIRAELTQSFGGGRYADSRQAREGSCTAGEIHPYTIVFGHQAGRFVPGRATLSGFVEAYAECCLPPSDLESFPVTTVILRPA